MAYRHCLNKVLALPKIWSLTNVSDSQRRPEALATETMLLISHKKKKKTTKKPKTKQKKTGSGLDELIRNVNKTLHLRISDRKNAGGYSRRNVLIKTINARKLVWMNQCFMETIP